jgi:hypothetical protein
VKDKSAHGCHLHSDWKRNPAFVINAPVGGLEPYVRVFVCRALVSARRALPRAMRCPTPFVSSCTWRVLRRACVVCLILAVSHVGCCCCWCSVRISLSRPEEVWKSTCKADSVRAAGVLSW